MKLLLCLLPLLFFLQLLSALSAEILVPPNSQTVPLGSDAHFFCSGNGSITRWIINTTRIFQGANDDVLISRGFTFEEEDQPPIHNLTMTIEASEMNNNTEIQCETSIDTFDTSNPAFLIVIGSPSAVPRVRLQVVNATTLMFLWDPPFSWENYPILHYDVSLVNTRSGQILREERLPNVTDFMIIHQIPQLQTICAEVRFTITAGNAIGESDPSTILGGHPIALGPFQSPIVTGVVFMSNGAPVVDIEFKPPQVCSYQSANYTIVIMDTKDETALTIGPTNYSPGYNDDVIKEEITSPFFELDKQYSVAVTVETRTGNKTITAEFNTYFQPPATGGTENENKVSLVIVIAASVGGACLVALLGISVLVVCVCWQRRRVRSRHVFGGPSSRPPMVTNPIYEGVVYESIDEGKFRSVVDTSSPVSTEEFPQFPSNRSSQDYENTKKLADSASAGPSAPAAVPSEDNYTLMNPAGKPDQAPDNERSNLPSNDTLRYGPEPVTAV